jgi:small subunit ribosomal protein S20
VPHHKSCKKRLKTSEKARVQNRAVRSAIRTSLKVVRTADTKEAVLKEMPRLFSMLDKAAAKGRAGFNKNRVANYKSKVASLLNSMV